MNFEGTLLADPLEVSAGAALAGGLAGFLQPEFFGLSVASASLAAVCWLPRGVRWPATPDRNLGRPIRWTGLLVVGISWSLLAMIPASTSALRGLVLGLGAVSLALEDRLARSRTGAPA